MCTAKWFMYIYMNTYVYVHTAVIHIYYLYILFSILFHYSLLQDIEYSSPCCRANLYCLSVLYIIICISSSVGKESVCSAGDPGSTPGLGRSPGERNGSPLQYPCWENLMDRGAWWAAVHGVSKSRAWLSDLTLSYLLNLMLPVQPSPILPLWQPWVCSLSVSLFLFCK